MRAIQILHFIVNVIVNFFMGVLIGLAAVKVFALTGLALSSGFGLFVYLALAFAAMIAAGTIAQVYDREIAAFSVYITGALIAIAGLASLPILALISVASMVIGYAIMAVGLVAGITLVGFYKAKDAVTRVASNVKAFFKKAKNKLTPALA
jgi:hypothetical protein